MAQRTVVELLDDLDGLPAEETVQFSLDGVDYEIDLSVKNAGRLRTLLTPYLNKARNAGDARRPQPARGVEAGRPAGSAAPEGPREPAATTRPEEERNGVPAEDHGRIPAVVFQAQEKIEPAKTQAAAKIPQTWFQAPGTA